MASTPPTAKAYSKMTNDVLKFKCFERHLEYKSYFTKPELIKILIAYDIKELKKVQPPLLDITNDPDGSRAISAIKTYYKKLRSLEHDANLSLIKYNRDLAGKYNNTADELEEDDKETQERRKADERKEITEVKRATGALKGDRDDEEVGEDESDPAPSQHDGHLATQSKANRERDEYSNFMHQDPEPTGNGDNRIAPVEVIDDEDEDSLFVPADPELFEVKNARGTSKKGRSRNNINTEATRPIKKLKPNPDEAYMADNTGQKADSGYRSNGVVRGDEETKPNSMTGKALPQVHRNASMLRKALQVTAATKNDENQKVGTHTKAQLPSSTMVGSTSAPVQAKKVEGRTGGRAGLIDGLTLDSYAQQKPSTTGVISGNAAGSTTDDSTPTTKPQNPEDGFGEVKKIDITKIRAPKRKDFNSQRDIPEAFHDERRIYRGDNAVALVVENVTVKPTLSKTTHLLGPQYHRNVHPGTKHVSDSGLGGGNSSQVGGLSPYSRSLHNLARASVEHMPIVSTSSYLFIKNAQLKVTEKTLRYIKSMHFLEHNGVMKVEADQTGYYLFFNDSVEGNMNMANLCKKVRRKGLDILGTRVKPVVVERSRSAL